MKDLAENFLAEFFFFSLYPLGSRSIWTFFGSRICIIIDADPHNYRCGSATLPEGFVTINNGVSLVLNVYNNIIFLLNSNLKRSLNFVGTKVTKVEIFFQFFLMSNPLYQAFCPWWCREWACPSSPPGILREDEKLAHLIDWFVSSKSCSPTLSECSALQQNFEILYMYSYMLSFRKTEL